MQTKRQRELAQQNTLTQAEIAELCGYTNEASARSFLRRNNIEPLPEYNSETGRLVYDTIMVLAAYDKLQAKHAKHARKT